MRLVVLALALILMTTRLQAADNGIRYSAVGEDVSFSAVMNLPYVDASEKIIYSEQNPALQYGLLWLPESSRRQGKVPLVVFIHGGCWLNEYDVSHSFAFGTALAQAGYAVWSLEYRRSGDIGGGWPGSFDDVVAGVAFATEIQDRGIDLDRLIIVGHSAGGHLALLAGNRFPAVRAVIGLGAISNIVNYSRGSNSCEAVTTAFMGTDPDTNPELYASANPPNAGLHSNSYLLHGSNDAIVPLSQSRLDGATTVIVDGAGHFDWIHPGAPAFRRLLTVLSGIMQP